MAVVIPCFNHDRFVRRAVESVLAQSRPADEVIVVDDGSTDGSAAEVAGFGNRVLVLRQPNRGVAAARNAGVEASSSDLVAFLDADDEWLPTKLERQIAALDADATAALVHCAIELVDEMGNSVGAEDGGLSGDVADELLLLRRPVILGGGSGFAVRRAAFDAVGGFDESLSTSADWDLFYRVARRHRVTFVPERLVRYRIHGANMHRDVDLFRRDMHRALDKAFSEGGPPVLRLRRRSLARLHVILAGSYLEAGRLGPAIGQAARAVLTHPSALPRVAGTPLRWLQRPRPR